MPKKEFFRVPNPREILRRSSVGHIKDNLISEILDIGELEPCVIETDGLIPENFEDSGHFMRSGSKIVVPDVYSIDSAVVGDRARSGYVVNFNGSKKIFSLYENLEGSRIVKYCSGEGRFNLETGIVAKGKGDKKSLTVKIPSRMEGVDDHEIRFGYVEVEYRLGDNLRFILYDLESRHKCGAKRSMPNRVCAHEVAAQMLLNHYYGYEELLWRELAQIAIPTEMTVEFYNKLGRDCLVHVDGTKSPRRLLVAEKEILLWKLIYERGFDESFFTRRKE